MHSALRLTTWAATLSSTAASGSATAAMASSCGVETPSCAARAAMRSLMVGSGVVVVVVRSSVWLRAVRRLDCATP